ncbi:phage related protein [Gallibacterium anatis UMN179]|uniref:Phage related protein n=1 Tax=Gallibacterium anatis (strain UMN179) TaxID=1005058 RepID=F4HBX9_GALAU|nr:hypothetical protein [Gallibacterium anatis]AEC16406.1 phage related protein [Gallibacterium anatis UMN179]
MKYQLTKTSIVFCFRKLYRIQALKDLPEIGVKAGDLGGWIEDESNLSQDGNARVSGDLEVYGNAKIIAL